jgi:hypothetical protein
MNSDFLVSKWICTEEDFDEMGWHGLPIYAFAVFPETFEIAFDIDYVPKHVENENSYDFWVAPATLVFWNVLDLEIDIASFNARLEIASIGRTSIGKPKNFEHIGRDIEWFWEIECTEGTIKFKAVGYHQYMRAAPTFTQWPQLGMEERGGHSFAREVGTSR